MQIAIMQPYLFPYIGYFQLINAVDKFVFYDDVNFIKQGWINRNNILVNSKKYLFSLPAEKISSFKKINETKINTKIFNKEKKKIIKTFEQSYKKAPYFSQNIDIIYSVLETESEYISDFAKNSINKVCQFLEIDTIIFASSEKYKNANLKSTKRILDVCKKEKADSYINPIGGASLYNKDIFIEERIKLSFMKTEPIVYKQYKNEFISNLSIIDLMMFVSKNEIKDFLNQFTLL